MLLHHTLCFNHTLICRKNIAYSETLYITFTVNFTRTADRYICSRPLSARLFGLCRVELLLLQPRYFGRWHATQDSLRLTDVELLLVTVVVEPAVVEAVSVVGTAPSDGQTVLVAQVVVRLRRQPLEVRHVRVWKRSD